jgi:response regulator RpfG family c-di-GMP phosphodiesterase/signal transduction histidine kinase
MSPEVAQLPEMSCRAAINFCLYFRTTYGSDRFDKVYQRLQEVPLEYLLDSKNYISFAYGSKLLDALAEESGDPEFARKAGRFIASPQALGFAYHMFRALGTPRLVYEKLVEIGPVYNKVGSFKIDSISDTQMVCRYHSLVFEGNRRSCQARMGQFAGVPTIWGLPEAAVVERECQMHGAPDCVYEFRWQPYSRPYLRGALGVALGGLGGAATFAQALGPVQGGALGLLIGGSLGLAAEYRAQAKRKSEMLAEQDQGLSLSAREMQQRFEEILHLNQTLEGKVHERTQELSLASARLQAALEKQLELDKLKTQFFQNISHELRTPLTLILAPLDSLTQEGGLDRETTGQLDVMRRSAVRLLSMINSLLDLSRLEAGKTRLSLDDVDPAIACRQLAESARELASRRKITLRYSGPEKLGPVPLDQDKFDKVVLNLISNALKFTSPDGGREALVEVSAAIFEGRLRVSVRDTGIGIPEGELQNIFQRFHQVDGSDERKFGGTGIGLSLVKELVEFHLGQVQVESKQGVGSTFTLFFPLSRAAYPEDRLERRHVREEVAVDRRNVDDARRLSQVIANPAELVLADLRPLTESPAAPSPLSIVGGRERERLLLADDNEDMLTYLATILRRDYDVITASDGEQAYDLALQHLPQIIVSDVMMPKKNGYALVRDLKKNPTTRSIPIILVTAKADSYGKVAGIESGADDYLTKPFNFLEMRARIKQLLKTRALERSLAERNEYLSKLNFDLVLSKKEVFLEIIEAMAFALEAKDAYTHGHSRRVSLLSTELGRHLQLTELEIERVRIAAVLHDIGKLGIPEHILTKEDHLTPAEYELVQRHPEIGYRILESVTGLKEVNTCILMHHEKFDGSGYPLRKQGKEIPLESRIIAVADTYDAMTSTRPYRKGLSHARAIQELRDYSGTQFDPLVVRAFLTVYEVKPPQFPEFPSVFGRARA